MIDHIPSLEPTKYQIILFAAFVLVAFCGFVLAFFNGVKKVNAPYDAYDEEFPGVSAPREE